MTTPAEVVAEARTWIGTPFLHQAHLKGVGVDCAGLVRGVRVALGHLRQDVENEAGAQNFAGYARVPDGVALQAACDHWLLRIAQAQLGEAYVALVAWRGGPPQHLGIVGRLPDGALSLIHADGTRRVVLETRLQWSRYMRFVQAYRLPDVDYDS